jgi:3-dehydroquinate synthetase
MVAALTYGRDLGLLAPGESEWIIRLIRGVGRLPSLHGISAERAWGALTRDKKFRAGDIRMVFLRKPGEAEIRTGIDAASLRGFLKRFLAANGR